MAKRRKHLHFELSYKRLEQGQFHPLGAGDKRRLEWTELKLILEGIDLRSIRRFKRYRHPDGASVSL